MDPVAVTFDFWNTLAVQPGGLLSGLRRDATRTSLEQSDVSVDDLTLDEKLRAAGRLHDRAWESGSPFRPEDSANALADSFPELEPAARANLLNAFLSAGADAELQLTPGAAETIRRLSDAGIRLGIVCDVGLTGAEHLRGFLDRQGLLGYFTGWSFSDEVGAFKPSPVIFAHALESVGGIDPARAIHIGDLKRTDVAGSRAFGMTSVRYRGVLDDTLRGEEAHAVIDDLRELTPERASELLT